jgi:fused signal recognition particle receptor
MGLFDLFKSKRKENGEDAEASRPASSRMRVALNRTRAFFTTAFATDPEGLVDDEFFDELTDALVMADVGAELACELSVRIAEGMKEQGLVRKADVPRIVRQEIKAVLNAAPQPRALDPGQLSVILLVGVNGSGKTTLAAKLAYRLKNEGSRVLLAAADTFRAAAVDQLRVWAQRVGVDIVAGQEGADPASVVFDAANAASSRQCDVLIVDTAGRLQTKKNLMVELGKVARTISKACPKANVINILVLDATVGQNALSQAELFNETCELSGLALTKLDGTAKGGAVLAVVRQLGIPVLYVGVGEQPEDLVDFDAGAFSSGMIPDDKG